MTSLTKQEAARLGACETAIAQGLSVFVEVGRALTEIRDAKLYRVNHATFEAYCKERWEIGRSRAYELIDQAKVSKSLSAAGIDLSATADISKRDVRSLKDDPAAAAAIKSRVDAGEKPADAIRSVVAEKRAAETPQQSLDDLPTEIQAYEAAKAARRQASSSAEEWTDAHEVEELRSVVAQQTEEIAALRQTVAKYDDMAVEYEQGGFENVIAGLHQRIDTLSRQVERESQEKVSNLRKAEFWKRKAKEAGATADYTVDMETGDMARG